MILPYPSLSVIIPTKNRASDLEATIDSLLRQTHLPDELIVVDQSSEKSFTRAIPICMTYIHDSKIRGLTEARNAGMDVAKGQIWLFLDDDVILEPDFMHEILAAYLPGVTGVSGIITNYTKPDFSRFIWDMIFMRGPFKDTRQRVYWNSARLRDSNVIQVRHFGGGLMSFRASAIQGIRFDSNNLGASPGEDLDFCAQLPKTSVLVIAPRARLLHKQSPQARISRHWISIHAQVYYYLWRRHWYLGIRNNLCFTWLRIGYLLAAVLSCLKRRNLDSWKSWRIGARRGVELATVRFG